MMRCFTTLMLSAVVTGEIIYPKVLGNPALGHEGIKMLKIYMGKVTLSYHYGAFGLCTEDYDANGVKNGYSKLTLNDRQIYKQKYSDRCSTPVGRAELTNTELQLDSGDPYRMLQYIQKINNGGYDFKEYASGDCHPSLAIKATDVKKKVSSGPSLLPLHPIGICTKSEIDSFGLARDGTICIEKRRFTNPSCSGTPSNTRLKLYNTCFAKEGSSYADFITFTGFTPDDLKEALCMRALIDKTFSPSGTCGDIPAADTAELCKEIGLNIHEVTHSPPTGSGSGSSTSVAATLFIIFLVLVFLYCFIGAGWRYQHGAKGLALIPHHEALSKLADRKRGWFQVTGAQQSELDFVEDESVNELQDSNDVLDVIEDTDMVGDVDVTVQ